MEAVSVERKIKKHVYLYKIRIRDTIKDFDRHNTGKISSSHFRRALAMIGIQLTDEEFGSLETKYTMQTQPEYINATAFIDEIESMERTKELEKNPLMTPQQANETIKETLQRSICNNLSPRDEQVCENLFERFRRITKTQGLVVRQFFQQFDKLNKGRVTRTQFLSAIPFKISDAQADILVRKFKIGSDIDYSSFSQMCQHENEEEEEEKEEESKTKSAKFGLTNTMTLKNEDEEGDDEEEYEKVMEHLAAEVNSKRIRMEDFFAPFDKRRNGIIGEQHFRSGLSMSGAVQWANENQHRVLLEHYVCEDNESDYGERSFKQQRAAERLIRYSEFLSDLNEWENKMEEERDQTKTQTLGFAFSAKPQTKKRHTRLQTVMSPEKKEMSQRILTRIAKKVHSERIEIRHSFEDFDKQRHNLIHPSHFQRGLSMLKLVLSEDELECITEYYTVLPSHDIDYVAFVNEITDFFKNPDENANEETQRKHQKQRNDSTSVETKKEVDVNEIVSKIRTKCVNEHIRIRDTFSDFDTFHRGTLPRNLFVRSLGKMGFAFKEREFDALCDRFAVEGKTELVSYRSFVAQMTVDSEKKDVNENSRLKERTYKTLTKENKNEKELSDTIEQIRKWVTSHRVLVLPFFRNFDRFNHGKVNGNQFKQIITMIGIPVSLKLVDGLISLYANTEGDVLYLNFVNDITETTEEEVDEEDIVGNVETKRAEEDISIDEILENIRTRVIRSQISPIDFFKPFDKFRNGLIPQTKFITGLEMMNLSLTAKELAILSESYISENEENETRLSGNKLVQYREFIEAIETENTNEIEMNPTRAMRKKSAFKVSENKLDAKSEESIRNMLDRIHQIVNKQLRINLAPKFKDFDRHNIGSITLAQFQNSLNVMGISITEEELDLLAKKFSTSENTINYRPFLRRVE